MIDWHFVVWCFRAGSGESSVELFIVNILNKPVLPSYNLVIEIEEKLVYIL